MFSSFLTETFSTSSHSHLTVLYTSQITVLSLQTSIDTPVSEPNSSLYRRVAFILDIGHCKLFKPDCVKGQD